MSAVHQTTRPERDAARVFPCPNCSEHTLAGDYTKVSVGSISRWIQRENAKRQRIIDQGGFPPVSPSEDAMFSDETISLVSIPPILKSLHYELPDLYAKTSVLEKEVRLCDNCANLFSDDVELERRMLAMTKPKKPTEHFELRKMEIRKMPFYASRQPDRKIDFAFTTNQAMQRKNDVIIQSKRDVRTRCSTEGKNDMDWASLPANATVTKEVRRAIASSSLSTNLEAPESRLSCGDTSTVSVTQNDNTQQQQEANGLCEALFSSSDSVGGGVGGSDWVSSFDVPLSYRFMFELHEAVLGVIQDTPLPPSNSSGSQKDPNVIPDKVLQHISLPPPSVPSMYLQILSQPDLDFIGGVERFGGNTNGKKSISDAASSSGFGELSKEEIALLREVVADPTIQCDAEEEEWESEMDDDLEHIEEVEEGSDGSTSFSDDDDDGNY